MAITLTINGRSVTVPEPMSVIQAAWHAGHAVVHGVGCLEGICGACRALVRRADEAQAVTALACQTVAEDGMQVLFLTLPTHDHHRYRLTDFSDSWEVQAGFHRAFPEAVHCRHCGGCNRACPREIEVEQGVERAAEGRFAEAGENFLECVMCDLCQTACPERIAPNHVGLFARRVTAYFQIRPANLILRLEELRQGRHPLETEEPS